MTIVIHVSNIYFYSFGKIDNTEFLISVIFNSFARVCVPLFFMISGMLLINEKHDSKKYFKRISKFIIILIVWSIIYLITNKQLNGNILNKIIISIFNASETQNHLWYMYAIIGVSIALPFVQSMCSNLTQEKENLFLVLWLLLSGLVVIIVPVSRIITNSNIDITYPIPLINATYYLGYFICGYILNKRLKEIKNKKKANLICIALIMLSNIITISVTYFVSIKNGVLYEPMIWYRSIFTIISASSIFSLFIINNDKFNNKKVMNISRLTFGVYLIHMIFLNIIKENIVIINYSSLFAIPLITIIIYLVSLISIFIIKKIPVLRNLI